MCAQAADSRAAGALRVYREAGLTRKEAARTESPYRPRCPGAGSSPVSRAEEQRGVAVR